MAHQFFITKGSTLNALNIELIKDSAYSYDKFYQYLQASKAFFTMTNLETGVVKVAHQPANIVLKDPASCEEEYLLSYPWKPKDVDKPGVYIGQFEIVMDGSLEGQPSGSLFVPIAQELQIYVMEGSILKQ